MPGTVLTPRPALTTLTTMATPYGSLRTTPKALDLAREIALRSGKTISRVIHDAVLAYSQATVAARLTTPEPNGTDAWTAIREAEVRSPSGTTGRWAELAMAFGRYAQVRGYLAADALTAADAAAADDEELQRALGRLGVDP